jgi:gliding motility-associated-like protein
MWNLTRLPRLNRNVILFLVFILTCFWSHTSLAGKIFTAKPASPFTISLTPSVFNGFNINCNGGSDGSIDLTITGGTLPFTFIWSNGFTTEDIFSLPAGTYTVTVTDFDGDSQTDSITLTEPPVINTGGIVTDVTCNGDNNGSINITVTGGTGVFTFAWSNSQVTEDISGLSGGSYTVTVTDQNSCRDTASFFVDEPIALTLNAIVDSVNCFSGADGSIDITPAGGTPLYTYLWNNGATTQDRTGLIAGNYTVTVTDANSCTNSQTYSVGEPATLDFIAVVDSVNCFGGNEGAITLTTTGGTQPYTFLWNDAATTEDRTNLFQGTYTVTVTDANSCTRVTSFTVSQPSVLAISSVIDSVSCFAGNDGEINITPSGGTPSFTYLWNGGATTQDRTGLTAGNYTVTVTDQNSCTVSSSFTVSQPSALAISSVIDSVSCFAGSDGAIDITPSGGTPSYTYLWNGGATTQDRTGLIAGTYTVTVTDQNSCTVSNSFTVSQPLALAISSVIDSVSCFAGSDGAINITPSGGTPSYTYLWNGGATTQDRTGLTAGTYTVTVTDQNSCTVSGSFTVSQPSAFSISSTVDSVTCFAGSDGAIDITPSGGTPSYTYLWNGGATTQDRTGLTAGTYTVTVTDQNSCTVSNSFTVNQPSSFSISSTVDSVTCFAGSDGAIDISPSGGTPSYTYLWNGGAITQDRTGLIAGIYTVTVTDQNSCTVSGSFTVSQPSALSLSSVIDSVSCFAGSDGAINITPSGGTLSYTYLWNGGETTQDRTGLVAGTYTITVTDQNSCTVSGSFVVNQPLVINATTSSTPAGCGLSNGSATVSANGGTGSLSFLWNNGATTSVNANIIAGVYTVTVTDINSCTVVRNVIVANSGAPSIVLDSLVPPDCFGGSDGNIYISVTGGTTPYSYSWSNGAVTQDLSNLIAGTYSVTVTDSLSCTANRTFVLTQPALLSVTFTITDPSCGLNNGSVMANPSGGTSTYTYQWSNSLLTQTINNLSPGSYTVTVTDFKGCTVTGDTTLNGHPSPQIVSDSTNAVSCFGGSDGDIYITVITGTPGFSYLWSNGVTVQDNINIVAGQYTVTVTDTLGCIDQAIFNVGQPASALGGTFNNVASSCNQANGTSTVNASGGTSPYTYLWSNGQTTATAINLAAANYTVTVRDSKGCTVTLSTTVGSNGQPSITSALVTDVSCNGGINGSIDITVTGGVTPYTYLWTPGNFISQDISGVGAGNYIVTVTDSTGCAVADTFTINQPSVFSVTFTVRNSTCLNSNGFAKINVNGATPGYTYLWSTGAVTDSIFNQASGNYTVTVTDANSCDSIFTVFIGSSPGPTAVTDSVVAVKCFGNANGAIYITASGGTGTLQYLWSNSSSQQDLTNVVAGTYTVTVTDANLCTITLTNTVGSPLPLSFNLTSTPSFCGQNNGTATINNLLGGTSPYSYLWSNGDTGFSADSLPVGLLSVTIQDINGCQLTDSITITSSGGPQVTLLSQVNPSCYGSNDGSLEIDVTGANPPFTISWSNGDVSGIADSLIAGVYTVTVTDFNGCSVELNYTLNQTDSISVSFAVTDASCGLNNGSITATVSGGTAGYSLVWSNGDVGSIADSLSGNIYNLTVTDANFCSVTKSVTVNILPPPVINLDNIINVSCNGAADGGINITVNGGSPPINYNWSNSSTQEDLSGVNGGTYTVIVTDSAGCEDTLTALIDEPSLISINYTVIDASCGGSNGSITLSVSGGVPGYSYQWSDGQTTANIGNLIAGSYTVTVTDTTFCTMQAVVNVSNVNGPQITMNNKQMVTCFGGNDGQISVDITGGTLPYGFLWSNSETTQNISGLASGVYTLTVTDGLGCIGLYTDTITEPLEIALTAIIGNPTCFLSNGTIIVTPTGGTSPYTYLWSNGVTSSGNSGLAAGTYTVTITDANFCSFDSSLTLVNTGAPIINLISLNDASCFGASDGSIDIDVTGGVAPYTYLWQGILQTTQDVSGLTTGQYDLIVSDSTGCSSNAQYTVNQPSEIQVSFPLLNNTNCGQSNGTIIVSATGGSAPYTYLWSNGAPSDTLFNLSSGSYTVTVTDLTGCTKVDFANISDLGGPVIQSVDSTLITCPGGNDGSIIITATGGSGTLTYSWTNSGSNQPSINNLPANIYTVTVTDAASCQVIRSINITDPDDFIIATSLSQLNPPFNLSCYQSGDGAIDITVTGGTSPYIYIWSTGSNDEDINNLTAGTYTLVIRDSRTCEGYDTILLTQPPQITAFAGNDITICGLDTITMNADTIPGNLLGLWSTQLPSTITFGDASLSNTIVSSIPVGVNILSWTVSELNGSCAVSDDIIITVAEKITALAGSDKGDLCGNTYTLNATQPQFGSGYWSVISGTSILTDSSNSSTTVIQLDEGANYFTWTVNSGNCNDMDTVLVFRQDSVTCLQQLEIPTAYSPNADGKNDYFVVRGIEDYTSNKLTIVNRWGVEVYSKSNYSNEWNGVNNNNEPIPDGTYFYILRVDGINQVFKGFIDIRR